MAKKAPTEKSKSVAELMQEYQLEWLTIPEVHPYEHNPRQNKAAVQYVANSIKNFGFKVPIVVDKDHTIINGHTRLEAAKKLGLEKIPVIVATDLSEEQVKAFRLADNRVAEFSKWDEDLLMSELQSLGDNFDMKDFGFDPSEWGDEDLSGEDNPYTQTVSRPQYQVTGEKPTVAELFDAHKAAAIIERINGCPDIDPELAVFLKAAAYRHVQIDFAKVAEFYAHADKQVQELFEDSALVILDFNDAIDKGYVELASSLKNA